MTDMASGKLPERHILYAPGLKWRARAGGVAVPYWIPPAKDIRAGYLPKNRLLDPQASQAELAKSCRDQWADLVKWRETRGQEKPTKHTVGWLIDRYLNDPESPFRAKTAGTRQGYVIECEMIRKSIGNVLLGFKKEDGLLVPRIVGEDIRRWHRKWGQPVPLTDARGKPVIGTNGEQVMVASTPSRARHLIMMFRTLISYAEEMGVSGASELRGRLRVMTFPVPPPREVYPTFDQVDAIVNKAVEIGRISIAITTLAQYELMDRRVHIIGRWDGPKWGDGWEWEKVTPDWWITYFQTKVGRTLREFDLKTTQRLLTLMQMIPKENRHGPIIICETTGLPWRKRHYAEVFRDICRAAGISDDIQSRDMRAGAATEADGIEGVSDRALQDAGGWQDPKMPSRYRRNKQRNAQNVVVLRQANRTGSGQS